VSGRRRDSSARAGSALASSATCRKIETTRGPRWFEWDEHWSRFGDTPLPEVQCLGRDVTERRRGEAELKEARKQAEAAKLRQVALPGCHEPRDPHADERHPRA
jgi:hypothetical protein